MIARVDQITRRGQSGGKALIAAGVLAHAMRNLDRGFRRAVGCPAVDLYLRAIVPIEKKARDLHSVVPPKAVGDVARCQLAPVKISQQDLSTVFGSGSDAVLGNTMSA